MNKNRSAFTMIEVVFVIVVLGILAGIAIPKFIATRTDAVIAKGRSDIASIRTAISTERQKRFMKGDTSFIAALDDAAQNTSGETVFDGNTTNRLLTYGITTKTGDGGWMKTGTTTYTYEVSGGDKTTFTYNNTDGTFKCTTGTYCNKLTK